MRTFVIIILVLVAGKFAYDSIGSKAAKPLAAASTERQMVRIVEEMNRKLPMSNGVMQVERVEYSDQTLRYHGTLLNARPVEESAKAELQRKLSELYCRDRTLRDAKVSVEYAVKGVALKSISDRVTDQSWRTTVRPEDCK